MTKLTKLTCSKCNWAVESKRTYTALDYARLHQRKTGHVVPGITAIIAEATSRKVGGK